MEVVGWATCDMHRYCGGSNSQQVHSKSKSGVTMTDPAPQIWAKECAHKRPQMTMKLSTDFLAEQESPPPPKSTQYPNLKNATRASNTLYIRCLIIVTCHSMKNSILQF